MDPRQELELRRQLKDAVARGDQRAELGIRRQLKAASKPAVEITMAPPGTDAPPVFEPQATISQGKVLNYENDVPVWSKWFDRLTGGFKDDDHSRLRMLQERHPGIQAEVDPKTGQLMVDVGQENARPFDPNSGYNQGVEPVAEKGMAGKYSRNRGPVVGMGDVKDLPYEVADWANPLLQGAAQGAVLIASKGASFPELLVAEGAAGVGTEGISQMIGDATDGGTDMGVGERLGRQALSGGLNMAVGGAGQMMKHGRAQNRLAMKLAKETGVPESIARNEAFEASMNAGVKEGESALNLTPAQVMDSQRFRNWVEANPDVNTQNTLRAYEDHVQQPANEEWFKRQFDAPVDGLESSQKTIDKRRMMHKGARKSKTDPYFDTVREMFGDDPIDVPLYTKASGGKVPDAPQLQQDFEMPQVADEVAEKTPPVAKKPVSMSDILEQNERDQLESQLDGRSLDTVKQYLDEIGEFKAPGDEQLDAPFVAKPAPVAPERLAELEKEIEARQLKIDDLMVSDVEDKAKAINKERVAVRKLKREGQKLTKKYRVEREAHAAETKKLREEHTQAQKQRKLERQQASKAAEAEHKAFRKPFEDERDELEKLLAKRDKLNEKADLKQQYEEANASDAPVDVEQGAPEQPSLKRLLGPQAQEPGLPATKPAGPGQMTLNDLQDKLSELGFKSGRDSDAAYRFRQLLKDIENHAGDSEIGVKLLKQGRALYKKHSKPINDLDKQLFVKELSKGLEKGKQGNLMAALANTANEESLRKLVDTVGDMNPIAIDSLGDDIFDEMLSKATKKGSVDWSKFHELATSDHTHRNMQIIFGKSPARLKFYEEMSEAARLLSENSNRQLAASMSNAAKHEPPGLTQTMRRGLERATGWFGGQDLQPLFTDKVMRKVLKDPEGYGREFVKRVKHYAENPAQQAPETALVKFLAQLARERHEDD